VTGTPSASADRERRPPGSADPAAGSAGQHREVNFEGRLLPAAAVIAMRWTQTLIPTLKERRPRRDHPRTSCCCAPAWSANSREGSIASSRSGSAPCGSGTDRARGDGPRRRARSADAGAATAGHLAPKRTLPGHADALYKARDRAKKEWVLGPTHEEVITTIAAAEISSYRQLPKNFYQIGVKFRDEIRPRFGLCGPRNSS